MRSYIKIKGSYVWKLCALLIMVIAITCCGTDIVSIDQPTTATVNQTIPITIKITYCSQSGSTGALVVALLLPNGWAGAKNMTMAYTSTVGNGSLSQIPDAQLEHQSQLPWPVALSKKFGLVNNYISDMQWVAFQSDKPYLFSSVNGTVTVNIQLVVGADNNDADVNIPYVVAETNDGLADPDAYNNCTQYEYYELKTGPRLDVTGGTGDFVDYADPQLATVDPAKALIDDYITVTYHGDIEKTPLLGQPQIYLQATAYTTDNTAYPVLGQTLKTTMTETTSSSNDYKLSLWPRAYFGIPDSKTLDRIEYTFTDQSGNIVVGSDNSGTKFVYKFRCAVN